MRRVTKLIGGMGVLVWGFCASCESSSVYPDSGGGAVPNSPPPDESAGGSPFFGSDDPSFDRGGASGQPALCVPEPFALVAGGSGGAGGADGASSGTPRIGFGCPKTAPDPGSSCDWARVQCAYDFVDCKRTPDAPVFICCDTKWNPTFLCD